MNNWIPQTLKARSALIVFSVFILSHFASLLIYENNRDETVLLTEATDLADRVIGIVGLANTFPERERQRILAAAETQFIAMFPQMEGIDDSCENNDFANTMANRLHEAFGDIEQVSTSVCVRRLGEDRIWRYRDSNYSGFDVMVFIDFSDGQVYTFHAILPEGTSLFEDSVMIILLLAGMLGLLVAWYLIRKTIAPIERFAQQAESLGTNIDNPPMEENGPREVKLAARQFNQMQSRLARLLHGQTDMLAAISHDLRSAITRLRLRVDLLENSHERKGLKGVINDMRRMVESVIDFIRGQNPSEPYRKVNIAALVESLCLDYANEGSPVTCDLNMEDVQLDCRVTDVRRALANVIDNALTYGKEAKVSCSSADDMLKILVEDDGPGVPEQSIDAVTRPFFRVESSRNESTGGIGLGLAIVQNIVQSHGGQLKISNKKQGGLKVELMFPLRVDGG